MTILTDAIATLQAAEGTPLVIAPVEPYGYGVDYDCVTGLTERLDEVSGVTALAQGLLRRLTTERGSNPVDPDFGVDLLAYCNKPTTLSQIRELEGVAAAELAKDDDVESVEVTVTYSFATRILTVIARVTPEDPTLGPFTLIGALTPDGPILEEILT